ncbi:hypothetical protein KIW84_073497 [Lathyrus oleraceus]|uniref:Uncharacterized protein n=1 Tax=Pisum sativum TaxID=3888 RepID=A0A9D4VNT5_PEA|nr:hypothetical protein KIW84_073497 [Pisum sativum]
MATRTDQNIEEKRKVLIEDDVGTQVHAKGTKLAKKNGATRVPYQQWVSERIKIAKIPFSIEIPLKSTSPKPVPVYLEEVEKLRAMVAKLRKEKEDLQFELYKETRENMILNRKRNQRKELLEESHKKNRWKRLWDLATKKKKDVREELESQIQELKEQLRSSEAELVREKRLKEQAQRASQICPRAWEKKCDELNTNKELASYWKEQYESLKSQTMGWLNQRKHLNEILDKFVVNIGRRTSIKVHPVDTIGFPPDAPRASTGRIVKQGPIEMLGKQNLKHRLPEDLSIFAFDRCRIQQFDRFTTEALGLCLRRNE